MHYKPTQHTTARNLYFQTELSQVQIAQQVGINDRTLYRWMNEGQWKQLKAAARHMPAQIVENFRAQLVQMQIDIMSRPPGQNIPTLEETRIMSTLVLSISRMNVQITQSNSVQVIQNYMEHINAEDHELALANIPHADEFLKGKGKDGFNPYDFEFDCGTPYYLEEQQIRTDSDEPQDLHNPAQLEFNFPPEPSKEFQKKEYNSTINNTSPPSGEPEGASSGHFQTFPFSPSEISNPFPVAIPNPGITQSQMSGLGKKTTDIDKRSNQLEIEAKERKRQETIAQTLKEMNRDYPRNNKKRQNYW
jgi:transposase-like protein